MDIYSCQEAFGAKDVTSGAMKSAIADWYDLYYNQEIQNGRDPCQRIAYTVVSKLVRTVFGEYCATTGGSQTKQLMETLKSDAFKEKILSMGGYTVENPGEIIPIV